MKIIKNLVRKILGKFALWLLHLLRESENYADEKDIEFIKKIDEMEKTIKELLNGK